MGMAVSAAGRPLRSLGDVLMQNGTSFWVDGVPAAKGSRTQKRMPDGRVQSWEQNKGVEPWMRAVVAAIGHYATIHGALPHPYRIEIDFYMPRPASSKYAWPVKGDIDKLERATLDGLQKAGVITDDKHVIDLHSRKQFAKVQTGATVTIWPEVL